MNAVAIPDRSEVSRALAVILPPQHELFAVHVASGRSYRESARLAGFHEDNGNRLMRMAEVRRRVAQLAQQPEECVRVGISLDLLIMRARLAEGDLSETERADMELRLKACMAQAKLVGMIVDRKQVASARLSLDALDSRVLGRHVQELLESLEPGARARIQRQLEVEAEDVSGVSS